MQKIRILHIIKSLGRGGAEKLLPETLKLHDQMVFEFHYIYFLPWKNQMEEELRAAGGKVTCFPVGGNISMMLSIRKVVGYIREHGIHVIHGHLPWSGILARFCGKLTHLPIVYTEHNKQERYHVATRMANLATLNMVTTILSVSQDVAISIRKHKPNIKAELKTLSNGVNTVSYTRKLFADSLVREKLGIPSSSIVIGTIAVFRDQKRLDVWLQVAAEILRANNDVHFIIVGDGPNKEKLLELRKTLQIEGRVHMPGIEIEVRPYLAAFDIFMMTSIFEGLPIALLEAMAMECAVVSTDAGGIKEVVRHRIDGLLCDIENTNGLVSHANALINDTEQIKKFGSAARARIVDHFDMRTMVAGLESVYSTVSI